MRGFRLASASLTLAVACLGATLPAAASQSFPQDVAVNPNPADYTPDVLDGAVLAITEVGGTVVLGGTFSSAQDHGASSPVSRSSLLAFDASTGRIDPNFHPRVNGTVTSLAASPDGRSVFVGGTFTDLNGTPAARVAKLDVSTGELVPGFAPPAPNQRVDDLTVAAGRLFVAGHFTSVGRTARTGLVELDPATGAVLPTLDVTISGTHWGGTTNVAKLDVSPDGSRMVVLGNFTGVDGAPRTEIALLNLSTSPATVVDWQTDRFAPQCNPVYDSIVRDVQFAPSGRYFVVTTTGGYAGGPPTLCDSISRWETAAHGSAVEPTWVDYTGGDSTYSVAITDSAVYAGGHGRWLNNPYASNAQGPGAVPRSGVEALDPRNGLPLSWNPGRTRGHGAEELYATADGLYLGSDTDRVANEVHARIAFFPLAGGNPVPQPEPVRLPVDAYLLGASQASGPSNVLYRVNAGGPTLAAVDGGPAWQSDKAVSSTLRRSGSTTRSYAASIPVDSTVPGSTPRDLFRSERSDPSAAPEMSWAFRVPAGRRVTVRLSFADRSSAIGQRQFDVRIDGALRLDNFDIAAAAGDQVGTTRGFRVRSDGTVNIAFQHVVGDPLVNGIEIIDRDAGATTSGATDISRRGFDGSTVTTPTYLPNSSTSWTGARASTLIDGQLYSAWSNGHLYRRSFRGGAVGDAVDVDLHGLDGFASELQYVTGMFYDSGRLYYTRAGRSALYMRYLTVEDDVVGAQRFAVGTTAVNWGSVAGMFRAGHALYWVDSRTGDLHRVGWAGGGPVAGTDTIVSGPARDGTDWRARSLVAAPVTSNQPPTAAIARSCTDLSCSFDGTGSADADGQILAYAWDYGDGTSDSSARPSHTYATAGTYPVTLTVTDDRGATASVTRDITVADVVTPITFVGSAVDPEVASTRRFTVQVPADVAAGDTLLLQFSDNAASSVVTGPDGWTQLQDVNTSDMRSLVWQRVATAADAGGTVAVTLSTSGKGGLALLAYRGTDPANPVAMSRSTAETVLTDTHTTPAVDLDRPGSWVVSMWSDKSADNTGWTTSRAHARAEYDGTGAGHITMLAADSAGPRPTGSEPGVAAVAATPSRNAVMTTVVLSPAP